MVFLFAVMMVPVVGFSQNEDAKKNEKRNDKKKAQKNEEIPDTLGKLLIGSSPSYGKVSNFSGIDPNSAGVYCYNDIKELGPNAAGPCSLSFDNVNGVPGTDAQIHLTHAQAKNFANAVKDARRTNVAINISDANGKNPKIEVGGKITENIVDRFSKLEHQMNSCGCGGAKEPGNSSKGH